MKCLVKSVLLCVPLSCSIERAFPFVGGSDCFIQSRSRSNSAALLALNCHHNPRIRKALKHHSVPKDLKKKTKG